MTTALLICILCVLALLLIWFWPRPGRYEQHTTRSYNGRPYGADRE